MVPACRVSGRPSAPMTAKPTAVCDLEESTGCGVRPTAVARQKAGGRLCAVHADLPGLCWRPRRCVRPQIPGFSPGGLGPYIASSGSPGGLSSGFPFARRVRPLRPPSSGFPSSGVLRLFPSARARFRFPFGFPLGVPVPVSNLYGSVAAGRLDRHWSWAAGPRSPVPLPPPRLGRVTRPHSRWAAAVHDGLSPQNRLLQAAARQNIAAPEPPR
jgi:hypothetical protein